MNDSLKKFKGELNEQTIYWAVDKVERTNQEWGNTQELATVKPLSPWG